MKLKIIFAALFLILPSLFFVSCSKNVNSKNGNTNNAAQKVSPKYTCPMHPSYISDKPGDCPICGMTLVPVEQAMPVPAHQTKKKIMYRSTMNPGEVSDTPGKDSMGMEMERFEVEEPPAQAEVEGLSTINVSPQTQQLIGIKTAIAQKRDVSKTIRTSGRVAYDPELYYAQQEYLTSLNTYQQSVKSSQGGIADSAKSLVDSSRFRLKLMGLGDEQIENLSEEGAPDKSLLLTGRDKKAWVYAAIYEADLGFVKIGQFVKVSASQISQEVFSGEIVSLDPVIDPATRSIRARILIENENGILKPEAFLNVEIYIPLGNLLAIPAESIMDTGTRQVVFVDKGQGILEPREVLIGYRTDDYYTVKSGINTGEKVVTNANFLIDSESQLKAALKQAISGEHSH